MPTTDTAGPALALTLDLIRRRSVTPDDAGCLRLIGERLARCGFALEALPFGKVENLWARRGRARPLFVFAGHTDVVPAGAEDSWSSPPFEPVVRDGTLYGRGAADMKSALAAMVVSCERFVLRHPRHKGSIGFLLTSDEEGDAVDGTVRVVEHLGARDERIDWCLVGEPSSQDTLGDVARIGRRGSLNGIARIRGVQGHVAYPERARNPIHVAAPALAELAARRWDEGNAHFPPTGFQISNVHGGTGATNVIPRELTVTFNFRFNTTQTPIALQAAVADVFSRHGVDASIEWTLSGMPFLTADGRLVAALRDAVFDVTGQRPSGSTGGGTSDGRFIAPTGAEVVEFGVVNESIHKVDERVDVADIERLAAIYEGLLVRLLA
jgi:succinyl-diaminopimelate desuccinylase